MATFVKTPAGKFKAIIRRSGKTRCKTFTRKTDARTWATRIEADWDKLQASDNPGVAIPFSALADAYMEDWKGRDPSVVFRVDHWREVFGEQKLAEISPRIISEALREYEAGNALRWGGLDAKGKAALVPTGRKRSPSSINSLRSALMSMFQYAVTERHWIASNPVKETKARSLNNERTRHLSDAECDALLKACSASQWPKLRLLVLLALTTGARRGELLGLRWDQIDFDKRTALIPLTKNDEPKIITFPTPAIKELKKFREVGAGLLFPALTKPWKPICYRKYWLKALDTSGIEGFRFHDLRHSAASFLAANGATLAEIGSVLGHKSLQSTKRYTHFLVEHKARLTETAMGKLISDD